MIRFILVFLISMSAFAEETILTTLKTKDCELTVNRKVHFLPGSNERMETHGGLTLFYRIPLDHWNTYRLRTLPVSTGIRISHALLMSELTTIDGEVFEVKSLILYSSDEELTSVTLFSPWMTPSDVAKRSNGEVSLECGE